jgi:aryl-alcohol dehydrogenase-like predicted oxidoreductase
MFMPIPGTSSIAHFDENMQAANIRLSESELREIALG